MSAAKKSVEASLTSGSVRWIRASVVSLLTISIPLGCHLVTGGMLPPAEVLTLMGITAVPACWLLSGHRWSARELVAMFLFAQAIIHGSSMLARNDTDAMNADGAGATMVLSHVIGALVLVFLVRRGEGLLWSLVAMLTLRPLHCLLGAGRRLPSLRPIVQSTRNAFVLFDVWPHSAPGRAPPVNGAAATPSI